MRANDVFTLNRVRHIGEDEPFVFRDVCYILKDIGGDKEHFVISDTARFRKHLYDKFELETNLLRWTAADKSKLKWEKSQVTGRGYFEIPYTITLRIDGLSKNMMWEVRNFDGTHAEVSVLPMQPDSSDGMAEATIGSLASRSGSDAAPRANLSRTAERRPPTTPTRPGIPAGMGSQSTGKKSAKRGRKANDSASQMAEPPKQRRRIARSESTLVELGHPTAGNQLRDFSPATVGGESHIDPDELLKMATAGNGDFWMARGRSSTVGTSTTEESLKRKRWMEEQENDRESLYRTTPRPAPRS
jgi:hypothetical protein